MVAKGEQVTRLLDTSRDARDVIEAILGRERAASIGPLKRSDGGHLGPDDLKLPLSSGRKQTAQPVHRAPDGTRAEVIAKHRAGLPGCATSQS
jgi:hypothetical protein